MAVTDSMADGDLRVIYVKIHQSSDLLDNFICVLVLFALAYREFQHILFGCTALVHLVRFCMHCLSSFVSPATWRERLEFF